MKKYSFIIVCLLLAITEVQAQSTLVNTGYIGVDSNTTIVMQSDIEDSGTIANHKNSVWHFAGTNQQKINSISVLKFGSLYIDNPLHLFLNNHITIDSLCSFINGKILLNNYNCNLNSSAAITGYNTNSYFVTNGLGQLIQSSPASQTIIYPIGTIDDYLPVTLNNKGTTDVYSIRTQDSSYLKYDSSNGLGLFNAVQSLAVNKTWMVNEQIPGGADFDVKLEWNATEELPAFNRNIAEIRYYDYADSSWKTASNYVVASGSNPYSITKNINGINYLKNFPVGVFTQGAPLPVEWLSFAGKKEDGNAILDWRTTNSLRNSHFIIQKSIDGIVFKELGVVKANTIQVYNYTDVRAFSISNILYYRLKQVDLDGKYSYSKILTLKNSGEEEVSILPNPVVSKLNIYYDSRIAENISIKVIDAKGATMVNVAFSAINGRNNFSIPFSNYPSGVYYLTINTPGGKKITKEFIKR